MNDLKDALQAIIEEGNPPLENFEDQSQSYKFTKGQRAVLSVANGFSTLKGCFRVFGTERYCSIPSINEWNSSGWKRSYGSLTDNTYFIAEDLFGDQYGYLLEDRSEFVKFHCEGGEIEIIDEGINWLIESLIDPFAFGALDEQLLNAFMQVGAWPSLNEHLAFKHPLISGGKRAVENLGIESASLHLGTLSQISLSNSRLDDGTLIKRFV